jgi:MFS family permease
MSLAPSTSDTTTTGGTRVLAALVTAVFSYALMLSVVVPSIGLLERELHTTSTWSAWVLSAFLLSSAVATPLLGRLGDLYGRRRVLVVVQSTYAVGMLAAAAAQDIGQLIAARAVQGVGLALVPLSFAVLREVLPASRLPSAMGLVSSVIGAGAGAGLVVGGLLADHLPWRFLFVLGGVLALVGLATLLAWVPESRPTTRGRLDLPGAALLGTSLLTLLLALTEGPSIGWTSAPVLALFAVAAVLFVGLIAVERGRTDALLDVAELTDGPMLATHAAAFLFGAGSYVFYLALPSYAQSPAGFDASITVAGLIMLPAMLAIVPAGPAVGRLSATLGPRWPLAIGFLLAVLGATLLAIGHDQLWQHVVWYTFVGVGSGLVMGALPKLIADVVPLARTATANGINNIARTVGSVVGSQLTAAVLASGGGFGAAFWMAAAVFAVGVAVAPLAVRGGRDA